MANTARKLRKRLRHQALAQGNTKYANAKQFVHTQKQGTPYLDRAVGPGQDHRGNHRPSKRQARRNLELHIAANPPAKVEEKVEKLELDPKPWRLGRKRFAPGDLLEMASGNWHDNTTPNDLTLAPRKQYDQDLSKY